VLRVRLLTRGSPLAVTGGHLYHQHLVEAAPRHHASVEIAQASLFSSRPHGVDVVVLDSITAWRFAGRRRRRSDPPMVAMVHQPPGGVEGGLLRRRVQGLLDRSAYRHCAAVVVAGPTVAAELIARHGVPAGDVHVVEPGCDLPLGRPSADVRHGRRLAVVCVANWLPNKGVVDLLDAVAALPPDHVTLHLAGRDDVAPDYTSAVQARLATAELADRVVVHGTLERQQIADLFAGADVLALPSRRETYSTVLAEALAAGLPVVAWRTPHAEQVVADGVEALLVPPGDITALSGALSSLATDERRRALLAAAARRRGATLPRWSDTAAAFFAVLRRSVAAVEPADHGPVVADVDAAHAGVFDEQPPRDGVRHAERPGQRGLHRADVGHDDDHGRGGEH
jgi:glycosyltransferase involved in cell wall biosynthesis